MLLASSEGRHRRYEVREHFDGFLVEMRDLDSGALDDAFATVFRTMPVAFAFAEMSAASDRFAESEKGKANEEEVAYERDESERYFVDLSDRLDDAGVTGSPVQALYEGPMQQRRTLH